MDESKFIGKFGGLHFLEATVQWGPEYPAMPPRLSEDEKTWRRLCKVSETAMRNASFARLRKDWHACAENYCAAYCDAPKGWNLTYCCLTGFIGALQEMDFHAIDSEVRFLEEVAQSQTVPLLHCAHSVFARGRVYWAAGQFEFAGLALSRACEMIDGIAPSERARRETMVNLVSGIYGHPSIGEICDNLGTESQECLNEISEITSCGVGTICNDHMKVLLRPQVGRTDCYRCGGSCGETWHQFTRRCSSAGRQRKKKINNGTPCASAFSDTTCASRGKLKAYNERVVYKACRETFPYSVPVSNEVVNLVPWDVSKASLTPQYKLGRYKDLLKYKMTELTSEGDL